MLVVKIQQGKYYTTLARLQHLADKKYITKTEDNGTIFFKSKDGQLIYYMLKIHLLASLNNRIQMNKMIELPASLIYIKY